MTRLAVVPAAAPAPALSEARTALVDQLARIATAQEAYNALRRTGDRMRAALDTEADMRRALDIQTTCEADAMKAWAANPEGPMPKTDVYARECNEGALANARRAADTVRNALPEHAARQTEAAQHAEALRKQLPAMAYAILLEDAAILREELERIISFANEHAATLYGLRAFFDAQGEHRAANEVIINTNVDPMLPAIHAAQAQWQTYAKRLTANPEAKMEV